MKDEQILRRPIGWWLKQADARVDAAFAAALADQGVDRRGWQVLATLSRSPAPRAEVVSTLASFDEPIVVDGLVNDLQRRGLVEEAGGVLRLTPDGVNKQASLTPRVDRVRRQVATAISEDEYVVLVRLLAQLVAGLP